MFLADAASYGADKLWCLLKPIPIEIDGDSSACEEAEAGDGEPAAKRARGPTKLRAPDRIDGQEVRVTSAQSK